MHFEVIVVKGAFWLLKNCRGLEIAMARYAPHLFDYFRKKKTKQTNTRKLNIGHLSTSLSAKIPPTVARKSCIALVGTILRGEMFVPMFGSIGEWRQGDATSLICCNEHSNSDITDLQKASLQLEYNQLFL